MRKLATSIIVAVLMVVAVGCTSSPEALETEADFTGFITEIHSIGQGGTLGQIPVESQADKLVDKYMVTIKDETLIFKQDGENRRQIAYLRGLFKGKGWLGV